MKISSASAAVLAHLNSQMEILRESKHQIAESFSLQAFTILSRGRSLLSPLQTPQTKYAHTRKRFEVSHFIR